MTINPRRVLVVDDEQNIAVGIIKTLSQSGKYITVHASSGEQAQILLSKDPFDLVITDIRMPGMSGIDLLRHIRQNYADIGVIIMTAYGSTQVQEEASRRGSLLYIEKPFDFGNLQNVVDDFFDRRDKNANIPLQTHDDSIQGVIPGLQLMDVIQMNCLSRVSATLHVKSSGNQGIICFNKGDITHAETSSRSGKDAFFEIVSWKGGSFDTLDQVPPTVTILDSWEQLLMEGVSVMPDTPTADQSAKPKSVAHKAAPVQDKAPADTSKMLDRVLDSSHADATFIVTHNGFVIDKRMKGSNVDPSKSSADIEKLLPGILSLSKSISGGVQNEIIIRYQEKTVMMRNVPSDELLFIVVCGASVPSGEIFKSIERESENIKKIL